MRSRRVRPGPPRPWYPARGRDPRAGKSRAWARPPQARCRGAAACARRRARGALADRDDGDRSRRVESPRRAAWPRGGSRPDDRDGTQIPGCRPRRPQTSHRPLPPRRADGRPWAGSPARPPTWGQRPPTGLRSPPAPALGRLALPAPGGGRRRGASPAAPPCRCPRRRARAQPGRAGQPPPDRCAGPPHALGLVAHLRHSAGGLGGERGDCGGSAAGGKWWTLSEPQPATSAARRSGSAMRRRPCSEHSSRAPRLRCPAGSFRESSPLPRPQRWRVGLTVNRHERPRQQAAAVRDGLGAARKPARAGFGGRSGAGALVAPRGRAGLSPRWRSRRSCLSWLWDSGWRSTSLATAFTTGTRSSTLAPRLVRGPERVPARPPGAGVRRALLPRPLCRDGARPARERGRPPAGTAAHPPRPASRPPTELPRSASGWAR